MLKSNFSQPAFVFHGSGGELFSLERDSSTIIFKNRSGNGYATVIDAVMRQEIYACLERFSETV